MFMTLVPLDKLSYHMRFIGSPFQRFTERSGAAFHFVKWIRGHPFHKRTLPFLNERRGTCFLAMNNSNVLSPLSSFSLMIFFCAAL